MIGGAHGQVAVNTGWLSVPYRHERANPCAGHRRQSGNRIRDRSRLGALGWSVGVGDRNAKRQRDAVAKLRANGIDAFAVPIDVTDDAGVAAAAR